MIMSDPEEQSTFTALQSSKSHISWWKKHFSIKLLTVQLVTDFMK